MNIVVYFSDEDDEGPPFNVPEYKKSYLEFFEYGVSQKPEVEFYIARGHSYLGDGNFVCTQKYNPETKVLDPYGKEVRADIVYNKGDLLASSSDNANIVNSPKFNRLCKDKVRTALLFPDYSPATVEVKSKEEAKLAADLVPSDKVVIKPVGGKEGKGVKILKEKEIKKLKGEMDEPHVVQEFLDTSRGVKDIVKDIHDLRVLIMNGDIIQVYVRTPKEGKLISNVSKGGSLKEIGVDEIPKDILKIVEKVDKKLEIYYPRIYSIDFGYTSEGPKIFELNSQPGLPFPAWKKYYKKWHKSLFETLLSSLKK